MKQAFLVALAAAILVSGVSSLHAVGPTTRITIEGAGLTNPIVITEASVTSQFMVWSGPGTSSRGGSQGFVTGVEGFMIDWPAGPVVERQAGFPRFKVSFYVNHRTQPRWVEELAYVLYYEYDAATGEPGLVYLPGRDDPEWELNVFSILRRMEGNWLRPTSNWEQVVNPLIARAISIR